MTTDAQALFLAALRSRLEATYQALATHGSVPPALKHRTEGFACAGLALDFIDADTLARMLEDVHRSTLGEEFCERQGCQAINCIDVASGTVRLPVRMTRAPVWPSTSD